MSAHEQEEREPWISCRYVDHDALGDPPAVDPADHDADCEWLKTQLAAQTIAESRTT